MASNNERKNMGLPVKAFLYTLDQISFMTGISKSNLPKHIHYERRSVGAQSRQHLHAVNIAPEGEKPDWRVSEDEFIRWLRIKGWRVSARAQVY